MFLYECMRGTHTRILVGLKEITSWEMYMIHIRIFLCSSDKQYVAWLSLQQRRHISLQHMLSPRYIQKLIHVHQDIYAHNHATYIPTPHTGSPGTLPKVLYGYFGDRNANPEWIPSQLKYTQKGSFPYVDPVSRVSFSLCGSCKSCFVFPMWIL
jgi:hypothetical protein